ncbi:MAG: 6-phosphofructokinase [Pseudomonadota bacterium]
MKNICYAQSGGPTAVINESARAVIETAKLHPTHFGKVYAGLNGISGILNEELIDVYTEPQANINGLRYTPSSAFGSCRYKLKDIASHREQYLRLLEVFDAHNIGYFLYNGGGDSQDTAYKISMISQSLGYSLQCIGIPKTVDNDLPFTDCSPGFASAGKYLATSIREAGLDLNSMASSSTRVFIMETMGRHTGWLAAASGIAQDAQNPEPHIILFPEITFEPEKFLAKVDECVRKNGLCTISVSEGILDVSGKHLSEKKEIDAFGHAQLGGVASMIAGLIKQNLNLKNHWAVPDYFQRAARHLASKVDLDHAYAVGKSAVEFLLAGKNAVMPTIIRDSSSPYQWHIGEANLADIANQEKFLPRNYIDGEGFHITEKCREYLSPLIQGEDAPIFHHGLPNYTRLNRQLIEKKLTSFCA